MRHSKNVNKIVATVFCSAAVSSVAPNSIDVNGIDLGIKEAMESFLNSDLGRALTSFIRKLDPKDFSSTVKSLEKVSNNFGDITTGLKVAAYGLASLVGINLFKDFRNLFNEFYTSFSKKPKKIIPYYCFLPAIDMIAKDASLNGRIADRLVAFFRSQFSKYGILNQAKDLKFGGNLVLALSGNNTAGIRLWTGFRELFLGSGLDVRLEKVSSSSVTPRGFLERVDEATRQNDNGLLVLVYDSDLNVTDDEDLALKKKCSSHLVELTRYSVSDVCRMLENAIEMQSSVEFVGKNISAEATPSFLKNFAERLGNHASDNPNLIFDTASGVVTSIKRYMQNKKLGQGFAETLNIKVDKGSKGDLVISHSSEFKPKKLLYRTGRAFGDFFVKKKF